MTRPATLLRRIRADLDALEAMIGAKPKRRSVIRSKPEAFSPGLAWSPTPAATAPEPSADDTIQIGRERGAVAFFIREKGKTWKLPGPNPLEPGCLVRPKVLAEYRDLLDALAYQLANPEPEPTLT